MLSGSGTPPLVQCDGLRVELPVVTRDWRNRKQTIAAVDGVDLSIYPGEVLALVGESGCGKSTLGRALIGLYTPTSGHVFFNGTDISRLRGSDLRMFRQRVQIVFQDPFASLNPRMKVGDIVAEPLRAGGLLDRNQRKARVAELLERVGLDAGAVHRFPHSFSGGQRQRISIARALAPGSDFIVADEPVSALDVSIQAQVLNLLKELQQSLNLTLLFISHDLAVVRHLATRVAVMYLGQIVEESSRDDMFSEPLHPYTQALLSAVPTPDPEHEAMRERVVLTGDVPSAVVPPAACRFHTRCPYAFDKCSQTTPELSQSGREHRVACHLVSQAPVPAHVVQHDGGRKESI